jgi:hypothetical protein
LDLTHVCLKLLHACDQWHSSRESTPLLFALQIASDHGRPSVRGRTQKDSSQSNVFKICLAEAGMVLSSCTMDSATNPEASAMHAHSARPVWYGGRFRNSSFNLPPCYCPLVIALLLLGLTMPLGRSPGIFVIQ